MAKITSLTDSNGKPSKVKNADGAMVDVNPADFPHRVRQVGTTPIVAYCSTVEEANEDAAEKNGRAETMGIKARYEVVTA